jgi:tetratricopeptide (TPR) repeat protein
VATVSERIDRPAAPEDPREPPSYRRLALLLPGALALVAGITIAPFDGGFRETTWYPVALFLAALTALVLVVAPPPRSARSRTFELAMAAYALFTLWTFASIFWADVPGNAWDAGNRALLYGLVVALVGLRPWPPGPARAALWLVSGGITALAVGLLVVSAGDNPGDLFVVGRLADPVGYANATASLFLIGLFPAVHLATAREERVALRGVALAFAVILLSTGLMTQSRGGVIAFCVASALFCVLHPRRWAAFAALLVTAGLVALSWNPLTDVRNAASNPQLEGFLADARQAIVLSALAALVLGAAAAFAGRRAAARLAGSTGGRRRAERAFLALAAVVALGGVVFVVASPGWIDDRWSDFKDTSYANVETGETRFGGALGSGRYDYYRVALNDWRDHPFAGRGAESFQIPYLQQRRTLEAPRYAHSLAFETLGGLGLIGALLLAVFLGAAIACFAAVRRRGGEAEAGIATAAFAGFAVWFVHGLVDWLWQFAAVSAIAMGLLALAMRTAPPAAAPSLEAAAPPRSLPLRVVLAVATLAAAVSLAVPGAAARYERDAFERQREDPDGALERLDRAADLDRLSASPLIARAVLARSRGFRDDARADLLEAIEREPENWFAHFELALLDGQARRYDDAARSIAEARRLNPQQPLVAEVQEDVRDRRMIEPGAIERALRGQLSVRLQPFESE